MKIKVEICCGTTCYLLGAAELSKLENDMPESWREHVEVVLSPCLEACHQYEGESAPFVTVNGVRHDRATPQKVWGLLREELRKRGVDHE